MRLFLFLYFMTMNVIFAGNSLLFTYEKGDFDGLSRMVSPVCMGIGELQKWDRAAESGSLENKLTFYERTRLFTHLYIAQREAACLSLKVKGSFQGSLDPISHQVLSLFLADVPKPDNCDPYSSALSALVIHKIKARMEAENSSSVEFKVPAEKRGVFSAGWDVAKWNPWFARPSRDFWAPPPPAPNDPVWKDQICILKQLQNPMTEGKKKIIHRWAGMSAPWLDDWRAISNKYLYSCCIDFAKALQVRAVLMIGMYDCVAAYVTEKYHYLTIRPKTYDSSVVYIISVPKHPSYPAGHAAEGAVSSTILSDFFPRQSCEWKQMAKETGLSRIWAGIHYPLDIKAGEEIGDKVGNQVLQKSKKLGI